MTAPVPKNKRKNKRGFIAEGDFIGAPLGLPFDGAPKL